MAKKGGKEVVPSNPLEAEKFELQKDNEKSKEYILKYDDKLEKLKLAKEKIAGKNFFVAIKSSVFWCKYKF